MKIRWQIFLAQGQSFGMVIEKVVVIEQGLKETAENVTFLVGFETFRDYAFVVTGKFQEIALFVTAVSIAAAF